MDLDRPPPSNLNYDQRKLLRQHITTYITLIISIMLTAVTSLLESVYIHEPYHTSVLTGEAWVMELLYSHPERIQTALGVNLHVFSALISELREAG